MCLSSIYTHEKLCETICKERSKICFINTNHMQTHFDSCFYYTAQFKCNCVFVCSHFTPLFLSVYTQPHYDHIVWKTPSKTNSFHYHWTEMRFVRAYKTKALNVSVCIWRHLNEELMMMMMKIFCSVNCIKMNFNCNCVLFPLLVRPLLCREYNTKVK